MRVREGQRVLFRLLNASPTQNITLALPGHRFTVIALDGNPVPSPQAVDMLFLAPAERADVVVEMNRPGVWILGGVKDEDRKMGLGVVVEYANQRGEPQWSAPPESAWDYTIFGADRAVPAPDERLDLIFEKVPGGRGGYNRWTINGKSWPATNPLFTTEQGKRYRLAMTNKSGDNHPVHLHRHSFEVTKVGDKATAGVMKDTINMTRFSTVGDRFRRRRSRADAAPLSPSGSPGRGLHGSGDLSVMLGRLVRPQHGTIAARKTLGGAAPDIVQIGSNSSTALPEGSLTSICLPPAPCTISFRNEHPAAFNRSTVACRFGTSIWIRFQPPGAGISPPGIACPAPPAPGLFSMSCRLSFESLAKPGAGRISTWKPSISQ